MRRRDFPPPRSAAGYHPIWHGQKTWNGVAILARRASRSRRAALPGDPDDVQRRYLEAAVDGILVCCLYLPNGNPQPGPKFDYKLAWFGRLESTRRDSYAAPGRAGGDFNVVPTELDIYPTTPGTRTRWSSRSRAAYAACSTRDGPMLCA